MEIEVVLNYTWFVKPTTTPSNIQLIKSFYQQQCSNVGFSNYKEIPESIQSLSTLFVIFLMSSSIHAPMRLFSKKTKPKTPMSQPNNMKTGEAQRQEELRHLVIVLLVPCQVYESWSFCNSVAHMMKQVKIRKILCGHTTLFYHYVQQNVLLFDAERKTNSITRISSSIVSEKML